MVNPFAPAPNPFTPPPVFHSIPPAGFVGPMPPPNSIVYGGVTHIIDGGGGGSSGGSGINPAMPINTGTPYIDNSAALAAQAAADAAAANAAKQNLINEQIQADQQAAIAAGQGFYPIYNRDSEGNPISVAYFKTIGKQSAHSDSDINAFRNAVRAGTENLPVGKGTSIGAGTVQQTTSQPTYTAPINLNIPTTIAGSKSTIQNIQTPSVDYSQARFLEPIPKYTQGIVTGETYIKPTTIYTQYGKFDIPNEQILGSQGQQLSQSNKPLDILGGQGLGLAAFGISGVKSFVNTVNPVNILSMPEFIFSGNVIDKLSGQIEELSTGLRQTPATTSGSIAGTAAGMYAFGKVGEVVKGGAARETAGTPKKLFEGIKEPFINTEIKTPIKNDNAIIKFGEDPRLQIIRENIAGNIDYAGRIIQNKIDIIAEPVAVKINEAGQVIKTAGREAVIGSAESINKNLLGGREIGLSLEKAQERYIKDFRTAETIYNLNQEADIQSIINKANKKYVNDFFSTRAEETRLNLKGQREVLGKNLRQLGIQQDESLLNPFREIKSKANQLKFNAAADIKDSLDVVNAKARNLLDNSEIYNRFQRYSARRGSVEWEISKNIVNLNEEAKLQASVRRMNTDYFNRFFSDRADEILSSDLKSMENARQYLKNKYTGVKLQAEILKYNVGDIIGEKIINTKKIINEGAAKSGTFLNENLFQGREIRDIVENSGIYNRLNKYLAEKGSIGYATAEKIYNLNQQAAAEVAYRKVMKQGVNDFFYEKGKAVYNIKPALETRTTNIGELARKQFQGADLGVENSKTLQSLNKFDKDFAESSKLITYSGNAEEIAQMRKLARTKARGVIDFRSYEPTAETMKSNLPADLGEKSSLPKTLRSKSNFPKELGERTSLPADLGEKSNFNQVQSELREKAQKFYKRITYKEPEIRDVFISEKTNQLLLRRPRMIPSLVEEAKASASVIGEEQLRKLRANIPKSFIEDALKSESNAVLKPLRRIRAVSVEEDLIAEPKLKYNSRQYLVEPTTTKNKFYPVYKPREALAGVQSDYAQVMERPITKQVYPPMQLFNQPQTSAFANAQSSAQLFAEPQLFAQPPALAQPQGSAQAQRFDQSDKQLLKQEYKFDENDFYGLIGLNKKKKRQALQRIALYNVLKRTKGRFIPIAMDLPKGEALRVGAFRTQRSLQRTFKIIPSRTTEIFSVDIPSMPDERIFRNYQIKNKRQIPLQNTFIKRTRASWQTSSEKNLLRQARQSAKYFKSIGLR